MKYEIIAIMLVMGFFAGFFISLGFGEDKASYGQNKMRNSSYKIFVPVRAYIVVDESGFYTSSRNTENILELFGRVNRIWSQAGINFHVDEIAEVYLSRDALPNAINGNYSEIGGFVEKGKINVFFAQNLGGINGLALSDINTALVADYTTVNDFRTAAHEIGHLLSLRHAPLYYMLMARGKNGELITEKEALKARESAAKFVYAQGG